MSYYANSCDGDFLILKERQESLDIAIRDRYGSDQCIQNAKNIGELFLEFGLSVDTNGRGDIDNIYFEYNKFYNDDIKEFLCVIARFVEPGSYIAFRGEDDCLWAYYFDGLSWEEFYGEVTYPGMPTGGPKKRVMKERKG